MNRIPTFTATQLKNETGMVLDKAMSGPIKLTSYGRSRVYIVPADTFERLLLLEEQQLGARAIDARKSGMVGHDESMAFLQAMKNEEDKPVTGRKKSAREDSGKTQAAASDSAVKSQRRSATR